MAGKYEKLTGFLRASGQQRVRMTFRDIERIIGGALPKSARKYRAWWSNNPTNNVMTQAWLAAGYRTAEVDMHGEELVFVRSGEQALLTDADIPPLHGFMKGVLRLPPDEELTSPALPEWGEGLQKDALPSPVPEAHE